MRIGSHSPHRKGAKEDLAYEEYLCRELAIRGLTFERQKPLGVSYKEVKLDCGYRWM